MISVKERQRIKTQSRKISKQIEASAELADDARARQEGNRRGRRQCRNGGFDPILYHIGYSVIRIFGYRIICYHTSRVPWLADVGAID